jgi:hypothetical protein
MSTLRKVFLVHLHIVSVAALAGNFENVSLTRIYALFRQLMRFFVILRVARKMRSV